MKKNVVAPSVGESITEVSILKWSKKSGQSVKTGELLLEIESDKATVEIVAEHSGVLTILKQAGERIPIGEVVGVIDDAATATVNSEIPAAPPLPATQSSAPATAPTTNLNPPPPPPLPAGGLASGPAARSSLSPAARKTVVERGLDPAQIAGTGKDGRVTKGDALFASPSAPHALPTQRAAAPAPQPAATNTPDRPGDRRVPMSMLRSRIAERLVQAQHTAAILTTFNEVDMGPVMALRNQHKDAFKAKHSVPLSFMSFFTRACVESLRIIPEVNASIDGKDIIYHDYCDIGIAVGTDRGLVVPVVRNAGNLGFVEIEKKIGELALKARESKLSIADLSGGTFTISNGGTYGSLLSTPILNPPQSGILGMHKIQERPVAVNGKVEIRNMMYLALSYDHRLIDGKGAVTFLVTLKELLEQPEKLNFSY